MGSAFSKKRKKQTAATSINAVREENVNTESDADQGDDNEHVYMEQEELVETQIETEEDGEQQDELESNEEETENKMEENEEEEGNEEENKEDSEEINWDVESEDEEEEEENEYIAPSELISNILNGDINIELPSQVRIVRIFTSSTFTDTFHERNMLMVKVYPKLKEYCQSLGYDFQVVDMRWGVRDEATADHMTTELCMRELRACQQLSTGPNFITFLGQKYGYRPFPPTIVASEFEAMYNITTEEYDKELLKKWFWCDDNIIPRTYILQPITDILHDYNNQSVSKEERSKASSEWWTAFEQMQVVFRKASAKVMKGDKSAMWKYYMSVTEDEITHGLLKAKDASKHCYWFKRNIYDIEEHIDESCARNFIDKLGPNKDTEANTLVQRLITEKIPKILNDKNISRYDVSWESDVGIDPDKSIQHGKYLETLQGDFYKTLVKMIDNGVEERKTLDIDDSLVKEICQHAITCQEKSRIFQGREEVLSKIKSYLEMKTTMKDETTTNAPCVVYGPSGCGKTAIMAQAAKLAKQDHPDEILVARFLGTTSDSSTIAKLLYSVCCQIKRAMSQDTEKVPQTFKQLSEYFSSIMENLKESATYVIIFLDSIDQLAPDNGAFLMKWLPKELPSCVRIVISTLPDEKYQVLSNLQGILSSDSLIEVPQLPVSTATNILSAWLEDASRTLTESQTKIVMDAFAKCPLPLFLKLIFDETKRWESYSKPEDTTLQSNIKDAINMLFARLERLHGNILVSHSLGLITASKNGLSDAELDDVLSIDDEVLNDVYQYWTPPARRIPPLLWVRIRADLGLYIVFRGASGVLVNMWYHRQFIEVARERYLSVDEKKKYHLLLTEYFLGVWSNGKMKPFTTKNGETDEKDRLVSSQPNTFSKQEGSQHIFNYRKLSELPAHLIQSNQKELLKEKVLFNFDFMISKLHAFGYQYVIEDSLEASDVFSDDMEIKLIHDFLKMSGRILVSDPDQLPCQLVGRLHDLRRSQYVVNLLQDARASNVPCLYPLGRCFDALGGQILQSLVGHRQMINHASLLSDSKHLISSSNDSTVILWDLTTGRQVRSIDVEQSANMVFPYCNDTCAILVTYSNLIFQNLQTEEVYYNEYHSSTYGATADTTNDSKQFVLMGLEEVIVFNCEDKKPLICYKIEDKAAQNQDGFTDIIQAGMKQFAYTRGKNTEIHIRNIDDVKYRKKINISHNISTFKFTPDADQLIVLTCASKVTEAYKQMVLYIYSTTSWDVVLKYQGKDQHVIAMVYNSSICGLDDGLELIWPTMFKINFWNLKTGKEKYTLKTGYQGNQHKQAIKAFDNSLVVISMDMNNTAMQVYDLEELDFFHATESFLEKTDIEKAKDYIGTGEREMYLHVSDPNVALSVTPMDPILKFWDLKTFSLVKRVTTTGLFSTSLLFIDERHVLFWDYNKKSVYTIDCVEGRIVANTEGGLSDYPPSFHMNTWVYLKHSNELLMLDDKRKNIKIFDWKTGKCIHKVKTRWLKQAQHIFSNADGSIIMCGENDDTYTKSLPLMVYDTKQRKVLCHIKHEKRSDIRPETASLSGDGKYFFCLNEDSNKVNIWNISDNRIESSVEYHINQHMQGQVLTLTSSSEAEYLLVCYSVSKQQGDTYVQQSLLVAYEWNTWKQVALQEASGIVMRIYQSENGMRVLSNCQSTGEQKKALDLFDMCDFLKGDIKKVASFMPETDTRFSYLSKDGETVCVGLSGIDGVTFLKPCGTPQVKQKSKDVVKLSTDLEAYEKSK